MLSFNKTELREIKNLFVADGARIEKNVYPIIRDHIEKIIKNCIKDIDEESLNFATEKYTEELTHDLHDKIWRE